MNSTTPSMVTPNLPYNYVRGTHGELITYIFLIMSSSHFGLPILLATIIFSKKVQRHPTLISLCCAEIIAGIASSLLVYAGESTGPEPSKTICLAQASLLYGTPSMTAMAVFALVFHMFTVIRGALQGSSMIPEESRLALWMMLIAPYTLLAGCSIATAIVGSKHPEYISRDLRFFYCSVFSDPLTQAVTTIAAVILFATLVLAIWAVVLLVKQRRSLQRAGSRAQALQLSLHIRTIIFGFYICAGLALSILSTRASASPIPDLVIATTGLVLLFLFGTQSDILDIWCFWRSPKDTTILSFHSSPHRSIAAHPRSSRIEQSSQTYPSRPQSHVPPVPLQLTDAQSWESRSDFDKPVSLRSPSFDDPSFE